jgi:hypothetical protein
MLVLLLAASLCTNISVPLNVTFTDLIPLQSGDEVDFQLAIEKLFLVFPTIDNFTLDVFSPSGDLFRTIAPPTTVFFVYMRNIGGRVRARAVGATELRYFAVQFLWQSCTSFTITTFHREVWAAWSSGDDGNFTIGHNQIYCLLHLSDTETEVAAECDTEPNYDNLRYVISGAAADDHVLTGVANASYTNRYFSGFEWATDQHALSTSFSVDLDSPGSTLPQKKTFWARPLGNITIGDVGNFPPIDTVAPGGSSGPLSSVAIVLIVVGMVLAAIVLVVVVWRVIGRKNANARGRKSILALPVMEPPREEKSDVAVKC